MYARSEQGIQFSLNLTNVTDTGNVPNVSINTISFNDGLYFKPAKIVNGNIKITNKDNINLKGEFDIEMESSNQLMDRRRIKVKFGIVAY